MQHFRALTLWLSACNPHDMLFTVALAGLAGGFWLAWPPLGLIVPSALVLTALSWAHLHQESPHA